MVNEIRRKKLEFFLILRVHTAYKRLSQRLNFKLQSEINNLYFKH